VVAALYREEGLVENTVTNRFAPAMITTMLIKKWLPGETNARYLQIP